MKLTDLFKLKSQAENAKAAAQEDAAALEDDIKDLKEKAEQAAALGDEQKYISLSDKVVQKEKSLYVKRKLAGTDTAVSLEDARKAWNDHAQSYNKDFAVKYKAYEDARAQLIKQYKDLINGQAEMLKLRRETAKAAGINVIPASDLSMFDFDRLPAADPGMSIKYNNASYPDPMIVMLLSSGAIDRETSLIWSRIIKRDSY